jgi:hypothetical protein
MLGFAALAEVALAEVPEFGGISPIPPPVFPRAPTGKILVLDTVTHYRFGRFPNVNESCNLIFNVGPGPIPHVPVQFYFIDPLGITHTGDPNFAYLNTNFVAEPFPLVGFQPLQSYTYTFGVGELSLTGKWQVYVIQHGFSSATVSFSVLQLGIPDPLFG